MTKMICGCEETALGVHQTGCTELKPASRLSFKNGRSAIVVSKVIWTMNSSKEGL
jgi:hypothetical protein